MPRTAYGGGAETGGPFEEMLLPILDDLWRFARRLESDDERAADLLQDALLVGWRKFHQLERPAALRAWMGRIVYRTFLNRRRRKAPEVPLEELTTGDPPASPRLAPEERLLARRLRGELAAAVDELPPAQRLAVLLVDALGFTYAEAAETLAVPPGTVASRVARGRSVLRRALRHTARERGWLE